jgi:hypothetical protein
VLIQSREIGTMAYYESVIELTIGAGPAGEVGARIELEMPSVAQGIYEFMLYSVNGTLINSFNQNVSFNNVVAIPVNGTDVQQYTVYIRNPSSGLEGRYADYTVDFTATPPTISRFNENPYIISEITPPMPTPSPPMSELPPPPTPPME